MDQSNTEREWAQLMPRGRRDVAVISMDDELLLYDARPKRAYSLNRTAALTWEECDGYTTVADLRKRVELRLDSPLPEEILWLTLRQLERMGLVDELAEQAPRYTRQQLIKMGLIGSAALLPVVTTVRAPSAAYAASIPVS